MIKLKRIVCSVLLIAMLICVIPVARVEAAISAATYAERVSAFLTDARWQTGTPWGYYQRPKVSSWSSIGCCAYAADFATYVYGSPSAWNTSDFQQFYSAGEIRAGDIIYVQSGKNEHWFVVVSRTGNKLYTAEGNCRVGNTDQVYVTDRKYYIEGGQLKNNFSDAGYTYFLGRHYKFSDAPQSANLGDNFYASISRKATPDELLTVTDSMDGSGILSANAEHSVLQRWQFLRQSDGSYKISSVNNGYMLNVNNGSAAEGTLAVTWKDLGNEYQRWYIYAEEGGYRIVSMGTGMTLTVPAASANVATLCSYSGSADQILNIHVHSYNATNVSATCQAAAYTRYDCTGCKDSYSVSSGTALGDHEWEQTGTVAATCQKPGAVIYTCRVCRATTTREGEMIWSDWSATRPEGMSQDQVESKTQYRFRDKQSSWVQTESGTIQYVSSWPAGFNTGNGYYAQYNKTPKTAAETATQRVSVQSNDVVGYLNFHWCRGYAYGPINRRISESNSGAYGYFHAFYTTDPGGTHDGNGAYGEGAKYYYNADCCRDSYWYAQVPVYQQTYTVEEKRASGETWGDWSSWSDTAVSASGTRQVETRSMYRYVTGGLGDHKWDKGVVTKAPTATATGVKTYTCATCKSTRTEELPKVTAPAVTVTRVFGADRYATSFKAADTLKAELGIEKFQNVIVASGTGFADALAGSYLAAQKNAPILLVRGANVNDVKNYIKSNLASGGTVYLLGGVNAVPKAMESGLEGFNVKRLGGANRYDTNLLILKEAGVGDKDVIVCTGLNFADSLSASATGLPILLVKDGLYANQKEFLKSNGGNFIVVGGTNAVNATIEKQLASYGSVKRLAGNTRYDTSVLVAKEFFDAPTSAVLAYAKNFPDGLSGGPLAYALKAPLILTDNNKPAAAVTYATGAGIKSGYALGGTGLISDKVVKNIFSMTSAEIIVK